MVRFKRYADSTRLIADCVDRASVRAFLIGVAIIAALCVISFVLGLTWGEIDG